jgi:hypothetical protein
MNTTAPTEATNGTTQPAHRNATPPPTPAPSGPTTAVDREVLIQWCAENPPREVFALSRLLDGKRTCCRGVIVAVNANHAVIANVRGERERCIVLRLDLLLSVTPVAEAKP